MSLLQPQSFAALGQRGPVFVSVVPDCASALTIVRVPPTPTPSPDPSRIGLTGYQRPEPRRDSVSCASSGSYRTQMNSLSPEPHESSEGEIIDP